MLQLTQIIILYTRFVVCAIAHEVKGRRELVYVVAECAVSYRPDNAGGDAIQSRLITALCVLSYGMIS